MNAAGPAQSYYPYIFHWVVVTHASAVFNPPCCNGSSWLFNFRQPSNLSIVCKHACVKIVVFTLPFRSFKILFRFAESLVEPFMHRLLFCYALPPLLQSKSTSIWVHHILHLSASAPKKMRMPLKTSEPSGTSQSICTRIFRNLTEYLHRNPAQPHRLSALKPSATSPGLHRNPPEPHQVSAPEPSVTSTGICTGTLRNPPEPCPEPGVEAAPGCTGSHQS